MVVDPWEHAPAAYWLNQQGSGSTGDDTNHGANASAVWHKLSPFRPRVHFITQDSVRASSWIANSLLDLVYIDGDHCYAAVSADIAAWAPKLRHGGVLSGHDYDAGYPGVVRAVRQFADAVGSQLWLGSDSVWWVVL